MRLEGIGDVRRALVLGAGSSGEAAARLLLREGCDVAVCDEAAGGAAASRARELAGLGVRVALGAQELPAGRFDLCVASPGIPAGHRWMAEAAGRCPVLGELELGWRFSRCPVMALTGSNGKTTTVKLCHEALLAAGCRAAAGGNYGTPVSQMVIDRPDAEWLVLEVSSFQLEQIHAFRPSVAVLLNILPNHLDRYGTMHEYVRAKSRLFENLTAADTAVVPADAAQIAGLAVAGRARIRTFGRTPAAQFRMDDDWAVVWEGCARGVSFAGSVFECPVWGLEAAAAVAAVTACGFPAECVAEAARQFKPLHHRMEPLPARDGVRFVDDSKGTNLAAMAAAVEMCGGPVRLIAGGLLKETDLGFVKERLARQVRAAYLIGRDAQAMADAWRDVTRCRVCGTLGAAVDEAWRDASAGETILLSPGCASFDQFSGYDERGRIFADLVANVGSREAQGGASRHAATCGPA